MAPRSATAITASAPPRPCAVSVVPSIGSTAMSVSGGVPSPIFSPLNSIGALSFSPSPMTTMPSIGTVESTVRMASTAAPSAPSLSPRPIQRLAAIAAASVVRTRSRARLRSGACRGETTIGTTISDGRSAMAGTAPGQPRYLDPWTASSSTPGPLSGTVRAGGAKNSAPELMGRPPDGGALGPVERARHRGRRHIAEVLRALGARVDRLGGGEVAVTTPPADALVPEPPYELVERMRASVSCSGCCWRAVVPCACRCRR